MGHELETVGEQRRATFSSSGTEERLNRRHVYGLGDVHRPREKTVLTKCDPERTGDRSPPCAYTTNLYSRRRVLACVLPRVTRSHLQSSVVPPGCKNSLMQLEFLVHSY